MRLRGQLVGAPLLMARFARISRDARPSLRGAVLREAESLRRAARERLDDPGRAPVSRSGALARTLEIRLEGEAAEVGSALPQAGFLEFGTLRSPALPWLGPAFLALKGPAAARIRAALRDLLRGKKGKRS